MLLKIWSEKSMLYWKFSRQFGIQPIAEGFPNEIF